MKLLAQDRLNAAFGRPIRDVVKVKAWSLSPAVGLVLQVDQPTQDDAAYIWLPYPDAAAAVPEFALEYPGEAGRHSGTYASAGLTRGEPVLKLKVQTSGELDAVINYAQAMAANTTLPQIFREKATPGTAAYGSFDKTASADSGNVAFIDPKMMPKASPPKPRRMAIPRHIQREVWQRDGGLCVECHSRSNLCFDHMVPFSRGGSSSVRNLQLLCENCNLSKGNRI